MGMTKITAQLGLIHLETLISKVKQDTGALYGYDRDITAQTGLIHLESLISKVKQDIGGLYGYDRDYCPNWIDPFGNFNLKGKAGYWGSVWVWNRHKNVAVSNRLI